MPNGIDKNVVRLCLALDGFRGAFGRWPERVVLPAGSLADLRRLLGPDGFAAVTTKVDLVSGDAGFRAEDASGTQWFDYGRGLVSTGHPPSVEADSAPQYAARRWLGLDGWHP